MSCECRTRSLYTHDFIPHTTPSPGPSYCRCHHCHGYISEVFAPAAALLGSEDITMATLDIEDAKEVQTKSVSRSCTRGNEKVRVK